MDCGMQSRFGNRTRLGKLFKFYALMRKKAQYVSKTIVFGALRRINAYIMGNNYVILKNFSKGLDFAVLAFVYCMHSDGHQFSK